MKKKILIAGFIVGLLTSVGYAEVKKKVDSFDGSASIESKVKYKGPFAVICFKKTKTSKGTLSSCSLALFQSGRKLCSFEGPLGMKMGEDIYDLPIVSRSTKYQVSYGAYRVDGEMEEKIVEADSITIRVYYSDGFGPTWKVPSEVLNEWKQVIRAEFNK